MEPFLGQIRMFGGTFAPRNWALCDGSILPISQWQSLYSILGTTYGGDGRTSFALPDLRGRVPLHAGSGPGLTPRSLGEKSGSESNTLIANNLPAHNHGTSQGSINIGTAAGTTSGNNAFLPVTTGAAFFGEPAVGGSMNAMSTTVNIGNSGGSSPVNNMQPYVAVTYIIALVGVFPSRN